MAWRSSRRPQLERIPRAKKKRVYLRHRNRLARTRVGMSQLVRSIEFHALEKKRLIGKIRNTVERLQSLEREAVKLERRAEGPRRGDHARRSAQGVARHAAPSCAKLKFPAKRGLTDLKTKCSRWCSGEKPKRTRPRRKWSRPTCAWSFSIAKKYTNRGPAIPGPDSGRQYRTHGRGADKFEWAARL